MSRKSRQIVVAASCVLLLLLILLLSTGALPRPSGRKKVRWIPTTSRLGQTVTAETMAGYRRPDFVCLRLG